MSTLTKLLDANKDLKVLVQIDNSTLTISSEYSWGKLDTKYCQITNIYTGDNGIYVQDENEPWEIFEQEIGVHLSLDDTRYEKEFADFLIKLNESWEKVIILYVDPLEEEECL